MKGELRKKQILEVSKKLFADRGYEGAHVEDVIREAKVGKGTFYLYFKNKDDLFVSMLIHFLEEWEVAVLGDAQPINENNVIEYFRTFIRKSFEFFDKNENLCKIYLRMGLGLNSIFEPYVEEFEHKMIGYITRDVKNATSLGYFRDDLDIDLTANFFAGAFLRLSYYYYVLMRKKIPKIDTERISEEFYKIAMSGLIKKREKQ
jgi:AcrR family transcriptional regulator